MIEQKYRKAIQIKDSWGDMEWEPNSFELLSGKAVVLQYREGGKSTWALNELLETWGEWQDVEVDNEQVYVLSGDG